MQKINHLYWRAGFGLSPAEWEEKKDWPLTKAVEELFADARQASFLKNQAALPVRNPKTMTEEQLDELRKQQRTRVVEENAAWVKRMSNDKESALLERMSLFWHGHFACRTRSGQLAVGQLNAIRQHALGNFRDLVLAIAKDPSMIRFLNNQQNRKQSPNENFARELMELFTIGRGHYSEQDIKEAARAFTGWSSDLKGNFVFRTFQHDYGEKTFFGKKGNFDGGDIIDLLLEQKQTARFITAKIYRYFVNPTVDEKIVDDLAHHFYTSGYDIGKLMKRIFNSDWFYEARNIGHKVKSPVEYTAGLMRLLDMQFDNYSGILFIQRALGQTLFNPPNVAGWPGGQNWIDNATLMMRLSIAAFVLNSASFQFQPKVEAEERSRQIKNLAASINLSAIHQATDHLTDQQIFDYLKSYLLLANTKISPMLFRRMMAGVKDREELIRRGLVFFTSLPEYQLC
jgi:uncharacterized protein (DUF1800 family)